MSRHVLGMGLLAVTVSAQANFASSGFEYVGCVEADPKLFGPNIDFSQPFTPQECQEACAGKASFAALGDGCRCDAPSADVEVSFKVIDEAACSVPCIPENPDAGNCGGSGQGDAAGTQLFSLFRKAGGRDERDDDCQKDEDAASFKKVAEPAVVIKTVTACPPEKVDCPLRAATKVAEPCPPEGCEPEPAPVLAPASPPTPVPEICPSGVCPSEFNKILVDCPPEGCRPCPPEGCLPCDAEDCLPACPEGCVAPPQPAPLAPTPTPIRAPFCPPEGCNAPSTLTPAPLVPSSAPISPPPPPQEPKAENPDMPVTTSGGRQSRAATVEMLTIMGAAIVLLAF